MSTGIAGDYAATHEYKKLTHSDRDCRGSVNVLLLRHFSGVMTCWTSLTSSPGSLLPPEMNAFISGGRREPGDEVRTSYM